MNTLSSSVINDKNDYVTPSHFLNAPTHSDFTHDNIFQEDDNDKALTRALDGYRPPSELPLPHKLLSMRNTLPACMPLPPGHIAGSFADTCSHSSDCDHVLQANHVLSDLVPN